jgi:hypothetical protein
MSFFWGSSEAAKEPEEAPEPVRTYFATEEETALVAQVRLLLAGKRDQYVVDGSPEYEFSDFSILRFLRGNKGVLETTVDKLVRHAIWRRERAVSDITASSVQVEIDKNKVVPRGAAKDGRPAFWVLVRRHSKADRDIETMYKFIVHCIEMTMKRVIANDERYCLVFDLRGFALSCMDYDVVKMLVGILQNNYPETLDRAIIVESPFVFSACWAIIRPWLDPVTVSKIIFTSYEDVGKYIAESEWPAEYVDAS